MKLFDYSELIRVIDNVEIREEKEKAMALIDLKEKYRELKRTIIESGILDDWNRLKQLCLKADVRLCVSHQGDSSMGYVIGHPDGFKYCSGYSDGNNMYNNTNGMYCECVGSGSCGTDMFGFLYDADKGITWRLCHSTSTHYFEWFKTEEEEYNTKIRLLETFRDTYEDYRDFQLKKIEKKFETRIKTEDIIRTED